MRSTRGTATSPSEDSYEDVTPVGGAQGTPRNRTASRAPEEEIDFRASPPADDGGPEDDPYDSDDASVDGGGSRTSSVFSVPNEGIDWDRLLDLTDPARFCLVRMARQVNGQLIACVCGRPKDGCTRRNHSLKRSSGTPGTIGSPGYYEPLAEGGNRTGADGRLDLRWYSTTEAENLRELQEHEQQAASRQLEEELGGMTDGDANGNPTVSFGGTTYHGGSPHSSPPARGGQEGGPVPEPTHRLIGILPQAPEPTPPSGVWYCMTRPSSQRVATDQSDTMLTWQSEGARVTWVAPNRGEAAAWVASWKPSVPLSDRVQPTGGSILGLNPNGLASENAHSRVGPTDSNGAPPGLPGGPSILPEDARERLLDKASRFAVGPDPSTGSSTIFGIDPADVNKMDEFLLPPNVGDGETRQEFYDLAMDVASLPGGYRLTDDDDHGHAEWLARAFGRAKYSPYRNWRKVTNNALARISSSKELLQFVKDVEKTIDRHRKAQEQRMRSFLLACRVPADVVALYIQSGMLPRILQETYRFYMGLLETLRSAYWETSGSAWKGGYVDQMVRHHSTELGQIRLTAADYRMHLLDTYVYLRNAHKEKFQDPSFTRYLLYSVAKGTSEDHGSDGTPEASGGTSATSRCKHCRRIGIHSGLAKEDCPLRGLPAKKAQQAVANLNKKQAKAVATEIKNKLAEDPKADQDKLISDARSGV